MTRLLAILAAAALAAAAAPAAAATLLPVVTVAGPVIHAGDIFAGAGAHATDAVAPAPPPGTKITYGANWLSAVANEHDLAWQAGSPLDQVTIVRASKVIDGDAIAQQLTTAIAAREPLENATFTLDNPGLSLVIATEAPAELAIDGLTIDQRTGRVSAYVSAPADDPAAQKRQVTGKILYRISIPELNHLVAPGIAIGAGDIDSVLVRRDRLAPDSATDPDQLIGKTPRRQLAPGQPVRLGDLAAPTLVHRDELVTVVLETDSLRLTSQAKALADGALGALVKVQNTKSSRVLDATVLSPGVVGVAAAGDAPAQRLAQQ